MAVFGQILKFFGFSTETPVQRTAGPQTPAQPTIRMVAKVQRERRVAGEELIQKERAPLKLVHEFRPELIRRGLYTNTAFVFGDNQKGLDLYNRELRGGTVDYKDAGEGGQAAAFRGLQNDKDLSAKQKHRMVPGLINQTHKQYKLLKKLFSD